MVRQKRKRTLIQQILKPYNFSVSQTQTSDNFFQTGFEMEPVQERVGWERKVLDWESGLNENETKKYINRHPDSIVESFGGCSEIFFAQISNLSGILVLLKKYFLSELTCHGWLDWQIETIDRLCDARKGLKVLNTSFSINHCNENWFDFLRFFPLREDNT